MILNKSFCVITAFMMCVQYSFAQQSAIIKKRFPVKSLGYESKLLDNNVNSVITDGDGFTWLSTFTGLQRFNGYDFVTIRPVAGKDTFFINYPVYLFGLNNGDIWISINEGILKYNHTNGKFTLVISYLKSENAHFGIVPLREDSEGTWCLQEHKGIVLYDTAGNLKTQFNFLGKNMVDSFLASSSIIYERVIASNNNTICVNYFRNNILLIDTRRQSASLVQIPGQDITGIACNADRLYLISNTALTTRNFETGEVKIKNFNRLTDEINSNNTLWIARDGTLLISRNGHLFATDSEGAPQYELTDKNYNSFVVNGYIQKIYSDDFNRIWILSNDGVERIQNTELLFEHLLYSGEQTNFVRALYYDSEKGMLLAGGYNGVLQLYDSLSRPAWKKPVVSKIGEFVIGIEKLYREEYLVVTYNKGWFIFNVQTRQVEALSFASPLLKNKMNSLLHNYANNLCRINDSVLIISTDEDVYRCVFKKDKLMEAKPLFNIQMHHKLNCFLIDRSGNFWLGAADGFLYKKSSKGIITFLVPDGYTIRSLATNDKNEILVGTERGLLYYNTDGKILKKIDMLSGLSNDCIYSIVPDANGCFVSTNLGISSIADDGTIHNYSKEMGLQEDEFNTNACLQCKNGKVFFGGINGITAFFPSSLSHVNDTVLIHITQLIVNDSSYNASSGIWNGGAVTLDYRHNRLRLSIAAMGMLNANEYVYQYRLKGLDTTWQTSYEPTNISYTLQPANYTLEIKCHPLLSSDQEFSKNFTIIITPPFWQTWWFRIVALASAAAMVYFFIYRYNKNKYLKKIRQLETQHQIQTERERISRELHDNIGSQLSLMISNIDWTIDSVDKIPRSEEIQRLSSINTVARNVMTNLRESIWALNKEKITLDEFADKLKAYIQNITEVKPGLEFISHESIKSTINFPPTETLNIFRICQEVVNNIIKHADATLIEISIASEIDQTFSITITDNGKGFDASAHKGYGLENMRFRASEMNLQLQLRSEKGKGTTVTIYK